MVAPRPTKLSLQRRAETADGEASADLTTTIDQARGRGRILDPRLRASMGQAMGADFSGVQVHTDAQADELNQSIQAKAFTTGQDVFFRRGEYTPESRGGQGLIAHELTHVVQQKGGAVQRSSLPIQQLPTDSATETNPASEGRSENKSEESRPNKTGLPDRLKKGIEHLSGLSMDDVKVHKNSSKPAQLNALAYTQASEIHVGPGQEQYLPHEGWHVVQQKLGRVKPTIHAQGMNINDDYGLEREADSMGAKAMQMNTLQKVEAKRTTLDNKDSSSSAKSAGAYNNNVMKKHVQMNTTTLPNEAVQELRKGVGKGREQYPRPAAAPENREKIQNKEGTPRERATTLATGESRQASKNATGKNPIQLVSMEDAFEAVKGLEQNETKRQEIQEWYTETIIPALKTIATKKGKRIEEYIAALEQEQFIRMIGELRTEFKQEPSEFKQEPSKIGKMMKRLLSRGDQDIEVINSEAYLGRKRIEGTNILVDPNNNFTPDGKPNPELLEFIRWYKHGDRMWYRAIPVTHFSWGVLQETGVLGSEGTADNPKFTMDNPVPTRWLPGAVRNAKVEVEAIAQSLPNELGEIRTLVDENPRLKIPTGAVLSYKMAADEPIVYFNSGEMGIRGPKANGEVKVDSVYIFSAEDAFKQVQMQGAPPQSLPIVAPYKADEKAAIIWQAEVANWVADYE